MDARGSRAGCGGSGGASRPAARPRPGLVELGGISTTTCAPPRAPGPRLPPLRFGFGSVLSRRGPRGGALLDPHRARPRPRPHSRAHPLLAPHPRARPRPPATWSSSAEGLAAGRALRPHAVTRRGCPAELRSTPPQARSAGPKQEPAFRRGRRAGRAERKGVDRRNRNCSAEGLRREPATAAASAARRFRSRLPCELTPAPCPWMVPSHDRPARTLSPALLDRHPGPR